MNNYPQIINLSSIYNQDTLNIFSDASIHKNMYTTNGCYGVVAVCRDIILNSSFKLVSDTTSNNSEIKGLRAAVCFADMYKTNFKYINIFSDSQISIFGLRDYIYKWRFNNKDGMLYGSAGTPVKNQEIFIDAFNILAFALQYNPNIRLFHQSGHVGNDYDKLRKAAAVFRSSNNINGNIDLNLIRYISTYNDYVDKTSRSILLKNIKLLNNSKFIDPVSFYAKNKISRNNIQ
jgi:ribonuclease HI